MANIPIDDNIVVRGDERFLPYETNKKTDYFMGTKTEWNALTSSQKSQYAGKAVIITGT